MNRFIASRSLVEFGLKVEEASNGKEAIDKFRKCEYDLIIMDINMPIMNGVEATKIIRNELKSKIPIIALTANAFKSDIEKYIDAGMDSYVTKPFNENYLYNTILEVLNMYEKNHWKKSYKTSNFEEIGGADFVEEVIRMFYEELENSISQIKNAVKLKDYTIFFQVIHKILPNVKQFEIESLVPKMESINEIKNKEWDHISEKDAIFILEELEEVRKQFETELKI